jgi:hypothetical protein
MVPLESSETPLPRAIPVSRAKRSAGSEEVE